jgi:hypothetical protein
MDGRRHARTAMRNYEGALFRHVGVAIFDVEVASDEGIGLVA